MHRQTVSELPFAKFKPLLRLCFWPLSVVAGFSEGCVFTFLFTVLAAPPRERRLCYEVNPDLHRADE